jgi:hypothetical protein
VDGSALSANAPSICRAKRGISVTMTGLPDTATFYEKIKANEQEHVTDFRDAANQFLVPHHRAIMALRGRGQDAAACRTDLQNQLRRVPDSRLRDFIAKVLADIQRRDTPGGHPTEQRTSVLDDCNRMEITGKQKPAPARPRQTP